MSAPESLYQEPLGPLVQDHCTVWRSLVHVSVSGSLHQDLVWPLAQDLCVRISCAKSLVRMSASGSCRTTCARFLYADLSPDLSVTISAPRSRPLVEDLCTRISCARSLCQDICIRVPEDLLRKISVWGSLAQGVCVKISSAGSCRSMGARSAAYEDLLRTVFASPQQDYRSTCARSLYADLLRVSPCQDLCIRILNDYLRKISVRGSLAQDLFVSFVRMSAPGSCRTTCARKISVCGSLFQDLSVRISAPRSCGTTCARSLHQDLLRKISVRDLLSKVKVFKISSARSCGSTGARSVYDVPRSPLQDTCRTTCARSLYADFLRASLCQDLCIRILYDHLRKISVRGSLVQNLSDWMSASWSCRTTCARSLFADLLSKISLISGSLHQYFARWTCTLSAEGCKWESEYATLPACRTTRTVSAKGCTSKSKKHNFKYQHFARWPRAISADGCASKSEITQLYLHCAHLTRTISAEGSHSETMLQKYCASHEIMSGGHEMLHWPRKSTLNLKFQKRSPSQELSPSTSKHRIHGAGSLRLPRKTPSFEWQTPANVLATSTKCCACHDFHNVPDSSHLARELTFLTSTCDGFLAPVMQNEVHVRKCKRTPGKTTPSKLRFRLYGNCVRACAVEINIESQNAIPALTKPADQSAYPNRTRPSPTVRTPECDTLFGESEVKTWSCVISIM